MWRTLVFPALLGLVAVAFAALGALLDSQPSVTRGNTAAAMIKDGSPFTSPALPDPFRRGEVKHVRIDIKPRHVEKLVAQRKRAMQTVYLFTQRDDYVPAKMRIDGEKARVRLRLKGDETEHLKGAKWSFRVKVRGNHTLLGMKVFSLQHPKTRNDLDQWIYHRALAREGVMHLRYEFVKVTINGKYRGLYALEEHFEKRLVEHNRRREGPLLKFDETALWEAYRTRVTSGRDFDMTRTYLGAAILPFRRTGIKQRPRQLAYFRKGASLLDNFRKGRLTASQVFDIALLARYYALSHLLGDTHGPLWNNVRFYYNPVTARLEPIGYDALPGTSFTSRHGVFAANWMFDFYNRQLFSDVAFFSAYLEVLRRVSAEEHVAGFARELTPAYDRYKEILQREFPAYTHSLAYMRENQRYLNWALRDSLESFNAYYTGNDGRHLGVAYLNDAHVPVQVLSVTNGERRVEPGKPQIVFPPGSAQQRSLYTARYDTPTDGPLKRNLQVVFRAPGSPVVHRKAVLYRPPPNLPRRLLSSAPAHEAMHGPALAYAPGLLRQRPNPDAFAFLSVDETRRTVVFEKGKWSVESNMILPRGYRVIVPAGTRLGLSHGASIVSFSPVDMRGTADAPVEIEAAHGNGGGFAVIQAGGESKLRHVIFRNLSAPAYGAWDLSGAVSFYESPVAFVGCRFAGGTSEDLLNVMRSRFSVTESRFAASRSDALDADFSDGLIRQSTFRECGNDCIDVSGSRLTLSDVTIRGAGDKGISVGERSEVQISDLAVANAKVAVASKDSSRVRARRVSITASRIGLSAYQKKPEFGPSRIEMAGLAFKDTDLRVLIEKRSSVSIDGKTVIGSGRRKSSLIVNRVKDGAAIN